MKITVMTPIPEGNQAVLLARVVDDDNTPYVQADLASIAIKCYDVTDRGNPIIDTTLTISAVIFDTLQPWPDTATAPDTTGYNFRFKTLNTYFPQGNREYQVEIKFTETSGDITYHIWRQPTLDLFQR